MSTLLTIVAFMLPIATVALLEQPVDRLEGEGARHKLALYHPSGECLRPTALGFDAVLVDHLQPRNVSYFGQHHPEPSYFYDYLTADQFLRFCGQLSGLSPQERRRRTEALLSAVGLERADKELHNEA